MKLLIAGHSPLRDRLIQLIAVSLQSQHVPLQHRLELAGYELHKKGLKVADVKTADIVVGLDTDSLLAAADHIGKKTLVFYDPHTVSERETEPLSGVGVPIEAHRTAKAQLEPSFAPYVFFGALCCFVPELGHEVGQHGLKKAVSHEYYQNRNRHILAFRMGWEGALPQRLQTI